MARCQIIPVFLPQWGCPYRCVYCDQRTITNQSGPLQVSGLVAEALEKIPPGAKPVEVAFYGGTFTALSLNQQRELLSQISPFLAQGRVDSIRVSTHPACIDGESLEQLRHYGVKTIELGVQSMDPKVLKLSGRDYGPETVCQAVNLLKELGFAVGVQLMPGLPGDSRQKTLDSVQQVIDLRPDFVRVYPTVVIAGTPLAKLWLSGEYKALTLEEAVAWCKEISRLFNTAGIPIVRMGLHPSRELEAQVLAGPYHPAFKALVDSALLLERIEQALPQGPENLTIRCNPRDIPVVRGHKNQNITLLQQRHQIKQVKVHPDPNLLPGQISLT